MYRRASAAAFALTLCAGAVAQTPLPADQAAMRAHVAYLASDAMKGREAGSAHYDVAAQYVAAQFRGAGLTPAGDAGGYLQHVPLVTGRVRKGSMTATVNGTSVRLVAGRDYMVSANPAAARTFVSAPVVFVGYGVVAPSAGRDDYRGVDVRGKIVAFVGGSPAAMQPDERAYFAQPSTKTGLAAARGAVGAITILPAALLRSDRDASRTDWADPDGMPHRDAGQVPLLGTLGATGAKALFGTAWPGVAAEVLKDAPAYATQALPATLTVRSETIFARATSSNVIGMLAGSDPELKNEAVVMSAHLDHIGVAKGGSGDRINNGALDDAIGIASLIEAARRFRNGPRPRRSILFLAVTAEEKGLVGSDWFVHYPTVPIGDIVADVNLDMPILTYRFEDMIAFGGDRSTLGPVIARAVAALGVGLSPDPMPQEAIFVRSDHFRFVQKGIPSVFLWPGQKGPGKAAVETFMTQHYHRPSDDLAQPIMWDQSVRFVDANYRIAREIADGDARPVWNRGDFFGMLFGGPMAR